MREIREEEQISVARACKIVMLVRCMYYYESKKDDSEVEAKLQWYGEKLPSRGFPEYFKRIRGEGLIWNHKKVRRVYLKLGMARRRKIKRRIPNPDRQVLLQPVRPNITWSLDFMEDRLENGRRFRTLNIIDDYNREALAIEVDYSFPSAKVVDMLKRVIEWRGKPEEIRSDNGIEFIAKDFSVFCSNSGINHLRIQKGKPSQNGYIERFNRTYREDVLDINLFESIQQVRIKTEEFMEDYNNYHPHESLNNMSPVKFLKSKFKEKMPTFTL
ncbi:MAG TPA: IS3 family transposase [Bacteroidales bacterium]|nr:IS3 family transposase [Bacteroidales bacterium]HOS72471.1 IS3 family transposase [Bacteroidales bacterium]HQH24115.1 IS3 family transposase [Bacteroidales bacterium]HQJ82738.1 IS3 family transposase [Bacteroidales bacterium]